MLLSGHCLEESHFIVSEIWFGLAKNLTSPWPLTYDHYEVIFAMTSLCLLMRVIHSYFPTAEFSKSSPSDFLLSFLFFCFLSWFNQFLKAFLFEMIVNEIGSYFQGVLWCLWAYICPTAWFWLGKFDPWIYEIEKAALGIHHSSISTNKPDLFCYPPTQKFSNHWQFSLFKPKTKVFSVLPLKLS